MSSFYHTFIYFRLCHREWLIYAKIYFGGLTRKIQPSDAIEPYFKRKRTAQKKRSSVLLFIQKPKNAIPVVEYSSDLPTLFSLFSRKNDRTSNHKKRNHCTHFSPFSYQRLLLRLPPQRRQPKTR